MDYKEYTRWTFTELLRRWMQLEAKQGLTPEEANEHWGVSYELERRSGDYA